MTTRMPTVFLQRLIAIGGSEDFSALTQLFVDFPPRTVGHFMRQRPEFWFQIADSLPDTELEALIRSLTIAERDVPEFAGGSVSGLIWTFRRLRERTGRKYDDLANWILAHTANGWAPYGGSNCGARSLAELADVKNRKCGDRAVRQQAIEEHHVEAAHHKSAKATRDMFAAIRRKDIKAIQALLLRGARIDVPDASGTTALAYAEACGDGPIRDLLLRHVSSSGPDPAGASET